MPNNKDSQNQKSGSQGPMGGTSDREFESQGQNKGYGAGGTGQQGGGSKTGASSMENLEDDELNTAGGRQGQFSDKDRGNEGQWSPGSTQETDR